MAEKEKPKELSIEEQIKLNVKKTLEDKFIQNVVGSNNAKNNPFLYGQLGVNGANSTYENSMFSENATKIRKEMYDKKKNEGEQLGVYGDPSFPSNYDVSLKIAQQVHEVMALGKIGDLEDHVKSIAKGFDFTVPDKLKNFSVNELIMKLQKGENLSNDEKMALQTQKLLSEAYTRAAALNSIQSNYYSDLNSIGKEITDAYKPKEKKE